MESLTDQVALVVGGSSGIGLGVGKALANEGMRVMLASRNPVAPADWVRSFNDRKDPEPAL